MAVTVRTEPSGNRLNGAATKGSRRRRIRRSHRCSAGPQSALAKASGLSERRAAGPRGFGLLDPAGDFYDGNDLAVARRPGDCFDYGVEPRHLRMYRQWAEREASFFEQIVAPMARRKDPRAS